MRPATQADIPAISAFLSRHIETSMFLMGNLEAHGIGNTDHPHGTRFHLREADGTITGVFGRTNHGMLMCQAPGLTNAEAAQSLSISTATAERYWVYAKAWLRNAMENET